MAGLHQQGSQQTPQAPEVQSHHQETPNRLKTTRSKSVSWPSLTFQRRLQHKRRRIPTTRLQKRSKPVFIDDLFMEPLLTAKSKGLITEKGSIGSEGAKQVDDVPRTSKEVMMGHEDINEVDDTWESLGLASPMMHGINERAEEFITRTRAEMQHQEMMARGL